MFHQTCIFINIYDSKYIIIILTVVIFKRWRDIDTPTHNDWYAHAMDRISVEKTAFRFDNSESQIILKYGNHYVNLF